MSGPLELTCQQVDELAPGFVLGALAADEMEAVRSHLVACPQPHEEVAALGSAAMALAQSVEPVEPPAQLRSRIMAAAAAERDAASARTAQPWPASPERARLDSLPRRLVAWRPAPVAWLGAAAALALFVALAAVTILSQAELQSMRQYEQGVADVLDLAARDGSRFAVLASDQPGGPQGIAAIGADGTLRIAMRGLEPTSGSEVYETWVIAGDAGPVAVGGFRVDQYGTASFATTAATIEGVTVALTLEPGPGATAPSSPVVALGTAVEPSS